MKTSIAQIMSDSQPGENSTPRDLSLIRDVPVTLTANLGTATLTVERLFALKRGDVVELEQSLDETVTFYMGEKPVARGHLVTVENHYGIELLEIL